MECADRRPVCLQGNEVVLVNEETTKVKRAVSHMLSTVARAVEPHQYGFNDIFIQFW